MERETMMNFFTADLHFNHTNIIKYCNRPFVSTHDMNSTLINNWNIKVTHKDRVYILGDFGFGDLKWIIEKLNGIKVLIIGSHDKATLKYSNYFESISPLMEINLLNTPIILSHYCMRTWSKSHYNSWHLYGHSHGTLPPIGKSWDVGVDNNNFTPLSVYEIRDIMNKREDNPNLVRGRQC